MIHRIKELFLLTIEFFVILWKMYKDGDFIPYDKIKKHRGNSDGTDNKL